MQAADDVVQLGSSDAPPADAGLAGVEEQMSSDADAIATAGNEDVAADDAQSSEIRPTTIAQSGTTPSQNSGTAAIQIKQQVLATAILLPSAIDAEVAPLSPLNAGKPGESFGRRLEGEQAAPSAASFFAALQPVQPSLQTWLDNWLGPRARARDGLREAPPTPAVEDAQMSFLPESASPGASGDISDLSFSEPLTPEQISQRYEDIRVWLDAHPGIEQGIAGASGSLPERNLFAFVGAGYSGDAGIASMPGFGRSPGLTALDGHALQPLRGINEGYTPLGVM